LTALPPTTDDVSLKIDSVQVFIGVDLLGKAALHVTQTRLSWVMESGQTFSLSYPSINMHSICRDTTNFPHACLFLMIEGDLRPKVEAVMKGEAPTAAKDEGNDAISEMRFVPEDSSQLQNLFDCMSDCQALHEDEMPVRMEDGDEEIENGDGGAEECAEYEEECEGAEECADAEEDDQVQQLDPEAVDYSAFCPDEEEMTPQGLATLKRLEACLANGAQNGTNQFEDAEPEAMTA